MNSHLTLALVDSTPLNTEDNTKQLVDRLHSRSIRWRSHKTIWFFNPVEVMKRAQLTIQDFTNCCVLMNNTVQLKYNWGEVLYALCIASVVYWCTMKKSSWSRLHRPIDSQKHKSVIIILNFQIPWHIHVIFSTDFPRKDDSPAETRRRVDGQPPQAATPRKSVL